MRAWIPVMDTLNYLASARWHIGPFLWQTTLPGEKLNYLGKGNMGPGDDPMCRALSAVSDII